MPIWEPMDGSPTFLYATTVTVKCKTCQGLMKYVSACDWTCEAEDCPEKGKVVSNRIGGVAPQEVDDVER